MSELPMIECARHGASTACFTCKHLLTGKGLGVHMAPPLDAAWPDALCAECAAVRRWTRRVALARLRTVCAGCWETVFGLNTTVRPHEDWEGWVEAAMHRADRRQQRWCERFDLGSFPHYQTDLEADVPWLGFGGAANAIGVRADAVVLGTWSRRSETWLWGWANSSFAERAVAPVIAVKRFAEASGLDPLWRMSCDIDAEGARQLAVAAFDRLPAFEGLYIARSEKLITFLGLRNTRYVM